MSLIESHLDSFVAPDSDAPLFTGKTGRALRPGSFWHIWDKARKSTGITGFRFHDLRHYAATTFAATGASTKEVMSPGGWKTVTLVGRYEHASTERDAHVARGTPALDSLETSPSK
jgi:integrase